MSFPQSNKQSTGAFTLSDMKGNLFSNDSENPNAPTMKGKVVIAGKTWAISAWHREDRNGNPFLSLKVEEPWTPKQ
jgi:uncharacterized protein (DUF736 family)